MSFNTWAAALERAGDEEHSKDDVYVSDVVDNKGDGADASDLAGQSSKDDADSKGDGADAPGEGEKRKASVEEKGQC